MYQLYKHYQTMSMILFSMYTALDTFQNLSFHLLPVTTCEVPVKLVIPVLQVNRTWQSLTDISRVAH